MRCSAPSSLLALIAVASPLYAQLPEADGAFAAGSRTLSVPGVAGGNGTVSLQVHYPALASGANQPLDPSGAPYPLVVFGHGFSLQVSLYASLFRHLATNGFVVVGVATEEGFLSGNQARYNADFGAAVLGMRAESAKPASPFSGAVAPSVRAAAAGHSFGGVAAIAAASARPDLFATLVTFAATSTSAQGFDVLAAVRALQVPALHFGASKDTIAPPTTNLDPIWNATPGTVTRRLLEIRGGTHSYFHEAWGIDRLTEAAGDISVAEQQRIQRRAWHAWLAWALRGDTALLDYCLGPTTLADLAFSRQRIELVDALTFGSGTGALATTLQVCPARRPGDLAFALLAAGDAAIPTPWGVLRLDPATLVLLGSAPVGSGAFASIGLTIPNDPALRGARVPFQGVLTTSTEIVLASGASFRVR